MSHTTVKAEQRKNEERKFLHHSRPGSRTKKAVKFRVRNVGCARTDKSCSASGAPGDKTCGRQIEDSYRHLSTKFTVCMSAKKDGKTASVNTSDFVPLTTSETCQLFPHQELVFLTDCTSPTFSLVHESVWK